MSYSEKCPLCQHPKSKRIASSFLKMVFECPKCGKYYMNEYMFRQHPHALEGREFHLACAAHEWHLKNPDAPFVLTDDEKLSFSADAPQYRIFHLDEMYDAFPKAADIIDRALLNLSRMVKHPMDAIVIQPHEHKWALFCADEDGAIRLLRYMREMHYVTVDNIAIDTRGTRYTIAPAGWSRVAELQRTPSESTQGFAAMWFASGMDNIWKDGIKQAIKSAGYNAQRIDSEEHNDNINDRIMAEIRKSKFVVADFTAGGCKKCSTCEDKGTTEQPCLDMYRARGGVYFEAGLAMGLGIPVIWTAKENQEKQIHFDTRQYNHIFYKDSDDLRERLKNRIEATIGHGPVALEVEAARA